MPPAQTHRLGDRETQKVINHPLVRSLLPSIAQAAKKAVIVTKRCSTCSRGTRRSQQVRKRTDLNAVREHIASLPPDQKKQLLKVLNTKELVIPFIRAKDRQRVKMKVS